MRFLSAFLFVPLCASAQVVMPTEFPADSASPSAETLRGKLAGNTFKVRVADGNAWRLQYKANGYAFLDTANGFRDTGTWRVEDGKLCGEWRKVNGGCNEVRLKGEALYLKRTANGEVVVMVAE